MKVKNRAVVFFSVCANILLFVGFAEECEEVAVKTGGCFYNVRSIALVAVFLVNVVHVLAASLCVL